MDQYRAQTIGRERTGAVLMAGFGLFGLLLAALGVYGVMAFSVSKRVAEIGIRMALGAAAADIVRLVLRRVLLLVGAGVAIGSLAAIALNRVLASLLTDVGRLDAGVLASATVLIVGVAAAACIVPSLGAARLDPVSALRAE
jgi:ABC-type antimicrobial peptide transport system permease subunit